MYFFDAKFPSQGSDVTALLIFAGQSLGHEADFAFELEVGFRNYRLKPEEVIFICPGYLRSQIVEYLDRKEKFFDGLQRFGKSVAVTVGFFNEFSDFDFIPVSDKEGMCQRKENFKEIVLKYGLLNLAKEKKDKVILKAPSGTIFLKPSGKEFSEFIKTSELAVGATENQFVAFCLLAKRPRDRSVRKIYIDTNSISPFIEALLFYLSCFEGKPFRVATYESYGSYSGKDKAKPDIVDNVWIVISASRSNSMGRKMVDEWGVDDDQVLTMLSYTDPDPDSKGDNILLNISRFSVDHKNKNPKGSLIKVEVVGENFTVEAEKPNLVTLKEKHKPRSVSKSIEPVNSFQLFKCNKKISPNEKDLPIYIDCKNFFNQNGDFGKWLSTIINWYVPSKTSHVVYKELDESSVALKDLIVRKLSDNGSTEVEVIDINSANISISGDDAIIVAMPVTGSGETLLNLNRNLRISRHDGNRIFISPFVVHSSRSSFLDLKNSLVFGPKGFKYQFFSCHEIFVGHDKEDSSWKLELQYIDQFENRFWQKRAEHLRKMDTGLKGRIGVSSSEPGRRLVFSQDFAFWSKDYGENVDPEAVYVTVSTILQSLREKPIQEDDSDSLFSYVYQHSVLSPDNFVRFNDPLLQSCIWRASDSRELDYRSSLEISNSFVQILSRLVEEGYKNFENAYLDLLVGIAVGKIQVAKEVIIPALKGYLENCPRDMTHTSVLLSKMITDLTGEDAEDAEIQF